MYKVSVGISALNEELNIGSLLSSILKQEGTNFEMEEIIVISDGSTDGTVNKVKQINDKRIKLFDYEDRMGKMQRFNEIFRLANGDIIISIDADVLPENKNTFSELIKMFDEAGVAFVSGRSKPMKPRNFLEESINVSRLAWDKFRDTIKEGHGVYASNGKFYAITKKLSTEVHFPKVGSGDQGYIYFKCLSLGFKSRGCKKAKVLFRSPNNIKDHVKQINRYQSDYGWKVEFGNEVEKEYKIPLLMMYKEKAKLLVKYPLHSIFLLVINSYAKHIYKSNVTVEQKWEIQNSTKEPISVK